MFVSMTAALLIQAWLGDWVWTVALTLVVGAFASLWVSRLIAGPFYRIERELQNILSGAVSEHPIHVRPGDPLGHLTELINQLVERSKKELSNR
ncbi:MAG TPA: hypothetical protein VMU17_05835 [Elusimicrobiota bacterium]|nr:hypothetical protein [Elusimicrobiota bacterium]